MFLTTPASRSGWLRRPRNRALAPVVSLALLLALGGTAAPAMATDRLPALSAPAPTISGTPAVGQPLTASAAFTPTPLAYAYQWKRNGSSISHAKLFTYLLKAADAGKKISVTVTAVVPGYRSTSATSKSTTVQKLLTATPIPGVRGTAKSGHTLTSKTGTWKPGGVRLRYQWYIGLVAIPGATKSSYVVQAGDSGTIWIAVTGSKSGYTSVTRNSLGTVIH